MVCQVVNSQSQLQARLPALPATLPTTQAEWTNFLNIIQQWGQALQQPSEPQNVLPPQIQTFGPTNAALALAALTPANCAIAMDNAHQFYGSASVGVTSIVNPATITTPSFPIPAATRWFVSFQIFAPSGATGSLTLSVAGAPDIVESFTVPSGGGFQQVWGLFDATQYPGRTATLKITLTSTSNVNLDGFQMNPVNSQRLGFLPRFTGAQMALGSPTWLAGSLKAFVSETALSKLGGTTGYDTTAYTQVGHNVCHVVAKPNSMADDCEIGLSTTPTANTTANNNNYSWRNNSGIWEIHEGPTGVATFSAVNLSDRVGVTHDGSTIQYWLNGVLKHSTSVSTVTLYGYAALSIPGSGWNSVAFGPGAGLPVIDSAGGQIGPSGSIPPNVPDVGFSYTTTSGQIVVTWPSFTLWLSDGTSLSISSGSLTVTGLTNGTVYTLYPFVAQGATTVSFATGFTGAAGSPAACYAGGSGAAAAAMIARGVFTLSPFNAVPSASGGGGGGDHAGCLYPETQIALADKSVKEARLLEVGDMLPSPSGPARIKKLTRKERWMWVRVDFGHGDVTVTPDHRFIRPDFSEVKAADLRLGDIVTGETRNNEVQGLELIRAHAQMVSLELNAPHLYYLNGALSHNLKP